MLAKGGALEVGDALGGEQACDVVVHQIPFSVRGPVLSLKGCMTLLRIGDHGRSDIGWTPGSWNPDSRVVAPYASLGTDGE
jgi:hypothetical protein